MKSSIKLHLGRWAIGLIAIVAVALAACGGAEQSTTVPAAPTPPVVNVLPAQPVIKDVPTAPVPAAEAEPADALLVFRLRKFVIEVSHRERIFSKFI